MHVLIVRSGSSASAQVIISECEWSREAGSRKSHVISSCDSIEKPVAIRPGCERIRKGSVRCVAVDRGESERSAQINRDCALRETCLHVWSGRQSRNYRLHTADFTESERTVVLRRCRSGPQSEHNSEQKNPQCFSHKRLLPALLFVQFRFALAIRHSPRPLLRTRNDVRGDAIDVPLRTCTHVGLSRFSGGMHFGSRRLVVHRRTQSALHDFLDTPEPIVLDTAASLPGRPSLPRPSTVVKNTVGIESGPMSRGFEKYGQLLRSMTLLPSPCSLGVEPIAL